MISISFSSVGILLNCLIIVMSLKPRQIPGNFKYFLANLALLDIVFATGSLLETIYQYLPTDYYPEFCPVVAALFWFGFYSLVGGLLPIPVSRYY